MIRNPRVIAHEMLQVIKRHAADADRTWAHTPDLRFYADEPGGQETWHHEPRQRADIRPAEYPENDPMRWVYLARWARAIAKQAADLEAFAVEQEKIAVRKGIITAGPEVKEATTP